LPPNDSDAEEAVIGSLLIDGSAIFQIADFLQPPDFYFEQNRQLYESCLALYQRDEAINQVTLAQELSRQGRLEPCGGTARLSYLVSIVPTSLDIEHYARIVYRLSIMRQMITAGNRITAIGLRVRAGRRG
jgi:replicative DNA helicase